MTIKKQRDSPPWWVRTPLYAATWPSGDCIDQRVSLHRQYLKVQRKGGRKAATRYARHEALRYSFAAVARFGWAAMKILRILGVPGS